MPLSPGVRLGPYEILDAIGAGGMGEVYRAHDTKLGRDVAVKVLPESFAHDAERMARFEREAQVLASGKLSASSWSLRNLRHALWDSRNSCWRLRTSGLDSHAI